MEEEQLRLYIADFKNNIPIIKEILANGILEKEEDVHFSAMPNVIRLAPPTKIKTINKCIRSSYLNNHPDIQDYLMNTQKVDLENLPVSEYFLNRDVYFTQKSLNTYFLNIVNPEYHDEDLNISLLKQIYMTGRVDDYIILTAIAKLKDLRFPRRDEFLSYLLSLGKNMKTIQEYPKFRLSYEHVNMFMSTRLNNIDYYVKNYTNIYYIELNSFLRFYNATSELSIELLQHIWAIDTLFLMEKQTKRLSIVYRGDRVENLSRDRVNIENGYLSTTLDEDVVRQFSDEKCCRYKIYVDEDVPYIIIGDKTMIEHEKEVLFPREIELTFIGIEGHFFAFRLSKGNSFENLNNSVLTKLYEIYKIQVEYSYSSIVKMMSEDKISVPEVLRYFNPIELLKYPDFLEKALAYGADPNFDNGNLLMSSILENRIESIRILLRYGANIEKAIQAFIRFRLSEKGSQLSLDEDEVIRKIKNANAI